MREVTLYEAVPRQVMATGEFVELSRIARDPSEAARVSDQPAEWLVDGAVQIERLKVVTLHDSERTQYLALDRTLQKYVKVFEDQAAISRAAESTKALELSRLRDQVRAASLWKRIKALFMGGKVLLR